LQLDLLHEISGFRVLHHYELWALCLMDRIMEISQGAGDCLASEQSPEISAVQSVGTCIDLFAGAGGFSLSALNAGLDVRLAIEWDGHACTTYENNIIKRHAHKLIQGDINEVDPEDLFKEVFPKKGKCDVVLGGPPCQGFSRHRLKNTGVNDPRNKLIYRYFEFVRAFKPKFFLLENMTGMFWPSHTESMDNF